MSRFFPSAKPPFAVDGPVRQNPSGFNFLSFINDWELIDTGALVGTCKLDQMEFRFRSVVIADYDIFASTLFTTPLFLAIESTPESYAALYSIPVPTTGALGLAAALPASACWSPSAHGLRRHFPGME